MNKPLPYPGYSWSFTQHAVGMEPITLYKMLEAASLFEGCLDFSNSLTSIMIQSGVLTPNQRNGKDDAWRDYQQILAELGLIYSTKLTKQLKLTRLGYSYLSGDIGFSEMMTLQALRYQYPNGQKSTIQKRLKDELELNKISIPENMIELQIEKGVLIRPCVLILRIIIELYNNKLEPEITTNEIQHFLIPVKVNSEWELAFNEIKKHRKKGNSLPIDENRHARRNIQDWMKFLSKTDLFELKKDAITLKRHDDSFISSCAYLVDLYEKKEYWKPRSTSTDSRITWFDYFGNVIDEDISIEDKTNIYIASNYIAGESEDFDIKSQRDIKLNKYIDDARESNLTEIIKSKQSFDLLLENLKSGMQKRRSKHILHEKIVNSLCRKFISQGATVSIDPSSVDIYAVWPNGSGAIFEVKTVVPKNIQQRLRLAIGQISEYSYRFKKDNIPFDDRVIVIDQKINKDDWNVDFLNNYMDIGLLCTSDIYHNKYHNINNKTLEFW
ncbi:hypothetical protein [Providencia vermicola]|uniref:hypothetical protein n=1 Tax=Providencia vermicola TaxID=333965 RepID=UPI002FDFB33B